MYCITLLERQLYCDGFDITFSYDMIPFVCAYSSGTRSIIALRDIKQIDGDNKCLSGLNEWIATLR